MTDGGTDREGRTEGETDGPRGRPNLLKRCKDGSEKLKNAIFFFYFLSAVNELTMRQAQITGKKRERKEETMRYR